MTPLLLFVIFPIATIFLAIILETIIRKPLIVSLAVFTIFFVLAFTIFIPTFVVAAIIYAILSYIVALIVELILRNLCWFLRMNFGNEVNDCCAKPYCVEDNFSNSILSIDDNKNNMLLEEARISNNLDNNRLINNRFINNRFINTRFDDVRVDTGVQNANVANTVDILDRDVSNNACNCKFCRMKRNG